MILNLCINWGGKFASKKNLLLYCLIPLPLPRLFLNFSLFYTRDVNFYDGETFSVLSLILFFVLFHCITVFFRDTIQDL